MPPKMTTMVPIAQLASLVAAQMFFQRAAAVSEWAMRQQLNETFGALIEMQAVPWLAPSVPKSAKL